MISPKQERKETNMEKEYRGQKIVDTFCGRMIPPNDNYPDCECLVVLTAQHLYVLEDNYDGTYETHFAFVLGEIDDIKIVQEENEQHSGNQPVSLANAVITEVICAVAGMMVVPTGNRTRRIKKKFFVISYHDVQGEKNSLYFEINQTGAKGFVKSFHKMKEL